VAPVFTKLLSIGTGLTGIVVDALTTNVAGGLVIPDTGDFERDLREFARDLVTWLTSRLGKAVVQAIVSDASRVPEIADLQRRFYAERLQREKGSLASEWGG
jgi:hypothetical protein